MIVEAIRTVVEGRDLSQAEAAAAMDEIMSGQATPAQIAAFITALRLKGETVDEITGCARVMRQKASTIRPPVPALVDTCGTGGDGANTFNISTAAAFVVAGAGTPVAKHGNRSVSSRCGSADVLEALGVRIDLAPADVERCIAEVGIGFLFAPRFHGAMKHAIGPRREIGIRTIFNVLGPLTNPAGATGQVVGVYHRDLVPTLAQVLANLGVREAFVVHGLDGLDEITISGETSVARVQDGRLETYVLSPEDVGLPRAERTAILGGDALANAAAIRGVLEGEGGPRRDVVLLNAAAAIVAGGGAQDLQAGVAAAAASLDGGRAREKLRQLVEFSRGCAAA